MGKKITELDENSNIGKDDFLYVVSGDTSKKIKFETMVSAVACEVPMLSNVSASEVNERDYIEIDIDNYDCDAVYAADNEIVTMVIHKSDNTLKVYFGSVDSDVDAEFSLKAIKDGFISSFSSYSVSITVKDKPEEEDDAIINEAFSDNEDSSSNTTVANDKVLFTEDNGEYKGVAVEQGDDEDNWSSYQTSCKIDLDELTIIEDDTDKDTLVVGEESIKDVSKVYIVNDDFPNGVEVDVGDVDELDGILYNSDPFNDGHLKGKWHFENSGDDLLGDYAATLNGDVSYVDDSGFSNKGILYNTSDENYVSVDEIDGTRSSFSICCFANFNTGDEDNDYTYLYHSVDNSAHMYGIKITDDEIHLFINGDEYALSQNTNIDKTIDKVFTCFRWCKDTNSGIPSFYVCNFTKNVEDTYVFDSAECTSDLDKGIDCIAGRNYGYSGSKSVIIDVVEVYDSYITDEQMIALCNQKEYIYSADISSNNLENPPTSSYLIEKNITIKSALTSGEAEDDYFIEEELENYIIDADNNIKSNTYKKVSDYTGDTFQRKIIGDKDANITYLKSLMWKDS